LIICDACIDAFTDDGLDPEIPIMEIPIDMGGDITDHTIPATSWIRAAQ